MPLLFRIVTAIVLATSPWLAACDGKDLTSANSGRVEAFVQASTETTMTNGAITASVYASIWDGSRWLDLGSPNGITIPLQLVAPVTVHGEQSVLADDYERVRLVFRDATVKVLAGSRVGGATLSNDVTLNFGGSDQRLEVPVNVASFDVERGSEVRRSILFDLRSTQWLTTTALQAGSVEDAALQAAVRATTREERR